MMSIFKYTSHVPLGNAGGYCTPNRYRDAKVAMRYLALPYTPVARLMLDPSRDWEIVLKPEPLAGFTEMKRTLRRAWPAFGRHGGAWELNGRKRIPIGNASGKWVIDSPFSQGDERVRDAEFIRESEWGVLSVLLELLATKGVWNEIQNDAAEEGLEKEEEGFKYFENIPGAAIRYKARGEPNREYCISFLAEMWNQQVVGLRLFGAVWEDGDGRERSFMRWILAQAESSFFLSSPLDVEKERGPNTEIEDILGISDAKTFHDHVIAMRRTLGRNSKLKSSGIEPCQMLIPLPCPFSSEDGSLVFAHWHDVEHLSCCGQ